MGEIRPPRRRVAGERARARRTGGPASGEAPATETVDTETARQDRAEPGAGEPVGSEPTGTDPTGTDPTGTESTGTEPSGQARRRGWPFVVAVGLAAVLVAGLATAAVLFYRVQQAEAAASARGDARAAARTHAQAILSYDHRTLDADFARAEKALTGAFKTEYTRTTTTVVRPSAEQYKVVVKAEVVASSVVRASADRAVVLLYVDQTTTSTRLEGPKVDLNRVRMTLVEQDGKWLVSELDAL